MFTGATVSVLPCCPAWKFFISHMCMFLLIFKQINDWLQGRAQKWGWGAGFKPPLKIIIFSGSASQIVDEIVCKLPISYHFQLNMMKEHSYIVCFVCCCANFWLHCTSPPPVVKFCVRLWLIYWLVVVCCTSCVCCCWITASHGLSSRQLLSSDADSYTPPITELHVVIFRVISGDSWLARTS